MEPSPNSFPLDKSHGMSCNKFENDDPQQDLVISWEYCSCTQLKPISTRVSALQAPACSHDPTLDEDSSDITPKARAYRIPELLDCPPAPRKKRAVGRRRTARATAFYNFSEFEIVLAHSKLQSRN
ncbi:hypothetical protein O6H91_22G057600 [Diphasiastrum complanatum]|uniref:Uncharacterized protein n=1 Tax=Diphasiastrum complanatum TaxID=34168 RepID=A0ACC2AHL2_DIPCM|nr:hypothetical protein O6H91_22G057600 [Diphasiastrum complanatum]